MKILKSKIHNMKVTASEKEYEGSVKIAFGVMNLVGLSPYEQVILNNQDTGATWTTYALPATGEKDLILCGGAAFHGKVGDRFTILAFEEQANPFYIPNPKILVFDANGQAYFNEKPIFLEPTKE